MTKNDYKIRHDMTRYDRTRPNVPGHKKRKMARLNATKRDLARSNTLANARNCMQTLVTTYTGTALTCRAPHVACKRFRNPDVAAIAPPLSEAPLRKILEISTKYYILPGDSVFHCQADEFCFLLRRASMSRSFHAISHPNVNRPGIDIHNQEIYLRRLSYNSRATLTRAFRVPVSSIRTVDSLPKFPSCFPSSSPDRPPSRPTPTLGCARYVGSFSSQLILWYN